MWLSKHKFHVDGTLSRYKARLVANGSSQQLGVDFDETFSLVVKPATIDTILSLVVSRQWPIHQLDVKNAFLNGLFLSRKKYALQLLERAYMVHCNPFRTPVDTKTKLGPDGIPVQDPTLYRNLAGGLHYLTFTHPDLSYAGTLELGLHLYSSTTTPLVGYTDAEWAGCLSTRSAKAEYQGVANVVVETAWVRNLLRELHYPLMTATLVYCDNVSAVYMSVNPVQHQRTKHIEIDIHFFRDMVKAGHVRVLHVPSRF
ncbi:ribonuclease H-like domain-containing protein [Tanacetum coccineum]|uniref:Ribonuclease H-like domain-containing protein n=1 Tax=Tanacetum coccineum TaxID=301880 RepID=A0ABQ5H3Y6_9ASTR